MVLHYNQVSTCFIPEGLELDTGTKLASYYVGFQNNEKNIQECAKHIF